MIYIGKQRHEDSPFCQESEQHGRCETWIFWRLFLAKCGVCGNWYFGTVEVV